MCFSDSFIQAEDGIRDIGVTGVQTCALPISDGPGSVGRPRRSRPRLPTDPGPSGFRCPTSPRWTRSEERRVGKGHRNVMVGYSQRKKYLAALTQTMLLDVMCSFVAQLNYAHL